MFQSGPSLQTERLSLIPFSLELKKLTLTDKPSLEKLLGVSVPDAWPGPDFLEALPFFIKTMQNDPKGAIWDGIIIHKADQRAIGCIGFHGEPDEEGVVEIGYNIIPEYEGHGYATEMTRCVIERAFQNPGINTVIARCLDTNIGSIRVLEKVGMIQLNAEDHHLFWGMSKPE